MLIGELNSKLELTEEKSRCKINIVKWYKNVVRRKKYKTYKRENKRHGRITENVSNNIQKTKKSTFLQSCGKHQNSD